jgi:6-phosphogluconate dehydrogenase (decarboxylating)
MQTENEPYFNSDVVIEKGKWVKGKTVFDVAPLLGKGDIILKGANAVDAQRKLAGIQIGNPTIGTSGPILQAVIGRRAELIIPVGLEKRVFGDIAQIAAKINAPSANGPRMLPVSGTIITELEALETLTGACAELVAAGGVCGAEGGCWIAVTGTDAQLDAAAGIIQSVIKEPAFDQSI